MGAGAEHLHGVRDARLRTQQVQRSCGEHGLEREEGQGAGQQRARGQVLDQKGPCSLWGEEGGVHACVMDMGGKNWGDC